jgi:hypothetical protein
VLGGIPFAYYHSNITYQLMEYSQDTELCNFGSDPDPLCIYVLCTIHTKGMDKTTVSTNELLNNYGWL